MSLGCLLESPAEDQFPLEMVPGLALCDWIRGNESGGYACIDVVSSALQVTPDQFLPQFLPIDLCKCFVGCLVCIVHRGLVWLIIWVGYSHKLRDFDCF